MALRIPIYIDEDNEVSNGTASAKRSTTRGNPIRAKLGDAAVRSIEPRLALSNVSNELEWTRPSSIHSNRILKKFPETPSSKALNERPLEIPKSHNKNKKVAEIVAEEEYPEIEYMPPNEDDIDDYEDIWPISERPTMDSMKWLMKWEPDWNTTSEPECEDIDEMFEIDDCIFNSSPMTQDKLSEMPTLQMETFAEEDKCNFSF